MRTLKRALPLPALVVPAYEPDAGLPDSVSRLRKFFSHVVVVNDGSPRRYRPVFEKIKRIKGIILLDHPTNLGKGAALKTAFRCVLRLDPGPGGIVTMDADGQHCFEDVKKVARALSRSPGALHLGVRSFKGDVPWKNRAGNLLTRHVFKFFTRLDLKDTQTGLRGIPLRLLPPLLDIRSKRFDFELEMLFEAKKRKMKIKQVPIRTIYADNNRASHFHPVKDSLKVYSAFLRRLLIS